METITATIPHTPDNTTGSKLPKLGFLGVGWIGKHRLQSLEQHKDGYLKLYHQLLDPIVQYTNTKTDLI